MRIVRCIWIDAAFYDDIDKVEDAVPMKMATYGLLIHDGESHIAIAHEECEDGRYRGVTAVPRAWIEDLSDIPAPPVVLKWNG